MIKDEIVTLLGDMEGPPSFAEYRALLSANVFRFPDDANVPKDPDRLYGKGWQHKFCLPESPIGIEDSQSLIILEDNETNTFGLEAERRFLFIQPLPRSMFPVDVYLAWGTCWFNFTTVPVRMNAGISKKGEWFVGVSGSEFSNGVQMAFTMQKGESMIGPGVTTAIEQIAYLANT